MHTPGNVLHLVLVLGTVGSGGIASCSKRIASSRGPYHATATNVTASLPWMKAESVRRAPYYFKHARRLYNVALRKGGDPFVRQNQAQVQILAALELDPESAETWFEAAKVTLTIGNLFPDATGHVVVAGSFLAKGCRLDPSMIERLITWARDARLEAEEEDKQKDDDDDDGDDDDDDDDDDEEGDDHRKRKRRGGKKGKGNRKRNNKNKNKNKKPEIPHRGKVPERWMGEDLPPVPSRTMMELLQNHDFEDWKKAGVPDIPVEVLAPTADVDAATCNTETKTHEDPNVEALKNSAQHHVRFSTHVHSTNVNKYVPEGFCDRLADLAIQKYEAFGREQKKSRPGMTPNELNFAFYSWQEENEKGFDTPEVQERWPEMYRDSKDFQLLRTIQREALRTVATKMGIVPPPRSKQTNDLWAAVYPGNGGRHGYHAHENALISCVLYCKTPGSKAGPIVLVDPRGAHPVNQYGHEFEPMAPFHRSEYIFPEPGDHICFPSWLVHMVPSHGDAAWRVAFPANLQMQDSWDAYLRTADLD